MKFLGTTALILLMISGAQAQRRPWRNHRHRIGLRYGYHVRAVPRPAGVLAMMKRSLYRYHAGLLYRRAGASFVVIRPPVRIVVQTLPPDCLRMAVGTRVYFYCYGNFYMQETNNHKSGYVVVEPPIGARVDALPDSYCKTEIDGNTYYEFGNVCYKAEVDKDGEVWYRVAGIDHSMETNPDNR